MNNLNICSKDNWLWGFTASLVPLKSGFNIHFINIPSFDSACARRGPWELSFLGPDIREKCPKKKKKQSCFTHINSFTAPYFWRETSRNNQKLKSKHCKRNLSPTILTGNRQGKLFPNFASHRLITHSCYHSDTFTVGICFNMWKRHAIFPINLPQGGDSPRASFVLE